MGFNLSTVLLLLVLSWGFSQLCFRAQCDATSVTVKLLKAPKAFSRLQSATFWFEALVDDNGGNCSDLSFNCKLDDQLPSACGTRKEFYRGLPEGFHTFNVCANGSAGVSCARFNWTIDTVAPTAYVSTSAPFTNALNVTVDILFSEPCAGFTCSSANSCNLLVYGAGEVMPHTLNVVQTNLRYSLLVALSNAVQVGRVIVVMDKNFCTDRAGNIFNRSTSSSSIVRFDRKNVFVNLRTHIPERLLQLNDATRTVLATNNSTDLNVYLYFSEPVLTSSLEVLNALKTSQGSILPVEGESRGNRKFSFMIVNITRVSIVTLSLNTTSITNRQGTAVSPIAPVTFLYDAQRPSVRLSTTCTKRTRQHIIPILVKFLKPVFGFNSSHISISGGQLQSFREISWSSYSVEIRAEHDIVSISIPENVTGDVSGNGNEPSNVLQVRHYSMPMISTIVTIFVTTACLITSLSAALLTVSTANLASLGLFSRPSSSLIADPARNLFRVLCYVQVFALSRWLAVTLPIEYYEVARGIQWSIPYLNLPWEYGTTQSFMVGSNSPESSHSYFSKIHRVIGLSSIIRHQNVSLNLAASVYGLPLTPIEYASFFESQNFKPEAEYISTQMFVGWRDFYKSMFWLVVIGCSLLLLHALLLLILKLRKAPPGKQKTFGALIFPRFEIFLVLLALPCICKASALLIKGGEVPQVVVGVLFLGLVLFLLLALLMFLSVGITLGKLLQYKEVHQEGQRFLWFHYIVQKTLGPGKRGQWTWKNEPNSNRLIMFGPLFEALRGPPKYMLTQIAGGGNTPKGGDRIIASDDETEDAEAPCIQKIFGILRIYYTLLECVKRVALGIVAGAYATRWSYRTPVIALLSITSFQLFFLVLKKPFIKKKVQLAEIISVSCEVGLFATSFILMQMDVPQKYLSKIGIFMVVLFLLGFLAQILNEWYALYRQIKRLDPIRKSLRSGLISSLIGLILLILPRRTFNNLEDRFKPPHTVTTTTRREASSSTDRFRSTDSRSPSTSDRPWLRQLREMAKASFSRDSNSELRNDPSTSNARSAWSGLWGTRQRSGSSSVKSSVDYGYGSKSKKMQKDMDSIFSSN